MRKLLLSLASCALVSVPLGAQASPSKAPSPDTLPRPTANPADVQSVDALLTALYDVISGPAGAKRDWNRFRSLFAPHARLMPARALPNGKSDLIVWSVDDYANGVGPRLEAQGFFEREIARKTEAYGNILHAFSTYESRRSADTNEKPFARGINSIQVLKDGDRWWVVSIFWDSERPGNALPAQYLPH